MFCSLYKTGVAGASGGMRTDEGLFKLLERFTDAKGAGKLVVMLAVRDFLAHQPLDDTVHAVMSINNEKWLNVLLGAGLRGQLYYAVVVRKAQLQGAIEA